MRGPDRLPSASTHTRHRQAMPLRDPGLHVLFNESKQPLKRYNSYISLLRFYSTLYCFCRSEQYSLIMGDAEATNNYVLWRVCRVTIFTQVDSSQEKKRCICKNHTLN